MMTDLGVADQIFRGTVRDGVLTLALWHPGLSCAGAKGAMLRWGVPPGVAVFDLVRDVLDRGSETIVHPRAETEEALRGAHDVIASWARVVGDRRVWFPEAVRPFEGPVDMLLPHVSHTGRAARLALRRVLAMPSEALVRSWWKEGRSSRWPC